MDHQTANHCRVRNGCITPHEFSTSTAGAATHGATGQSSGAHPDTDRRPRSSRRHQRGGARRAWTVTRPALDWRPRYHGRSRRDTMATMRTPRNGRLPWSYKIGHTVTHVVTLVETDLLQ